MQKSGQGIIARNFTTFTAIIFSVLTLIIDTHQTRGFSLVENHDFSFLGDEYDNGYPELKYNSVLEKFKEIYGPLIAARGGTFSIEADWGDGAVNMWAWRMGNEFILEIPGGMARYFLINEEAFVLSICHELGHLLGGLPLKGETISLEGQADYFATLKCMKRMIPHIVPYRITSPTNAIRQICSELNHVDERDCWRVLTGGLSLTSYYAKLEKSPAPTLESPSVAEVDQTLPTHPPAQCRLDTYLSGLRCETNIDIPLSYENIDTGACPSERRHLTGERPRCWFYPPH